MFQVQFIVEHLDELRFLGNCPTPPLRQHFAVSKYCLMLA